MPEENTSPYQTTPSSENKILRIALIVAGILLLVLLAEAGYFIYNNYLETPAPTDQGEPDLSQPLVVDDEPISVESPSPSPATLDLNTDKALSLFSAFDEISSVNDFVSSAEVNVTLSGSVDETFFLDEGDFAYKIRLIKVDGAFLSYTLTAEELLRLDVFLGSGETGTPATVSDIRVGDNVNIHATLDLLDGTPYFDTVIEINR
jgi:hypothetical protein